MYTLAIAQKNVFSKFIVDILKKLQELHIDYPLDRDKLKIKR